MKKTKLLINEYPLIVLPTLAAAIGLDRAILLQQLHYWLSNPKVGKSADEKKWVRNSLEEWRDDNFPFWNTSKISRLLSSLVDDGLILARDDLNRHAYDRTKWYTIDYTNLQNSKMHLAPVKNASVRNDTTIPETTQRYKVSEKSETAGVVIR